MEKNKQFEGFYISIKDNKEYKIYSNNIKTYSVIKCLKKNNFNIERIIFKWQINDKNVRLSKLRTLINNSWGKLSLMQKYCIIFLFIFEIVAVIKIFETPKLNPGMVSVIDAPISDNLSKIVMRIEQEGVKVLVTPKNVVKVEDSETARRMRVILITEDLIPLGIEPWEIFDRERWNISDLERNINFQRAQHRLITQHIKAIEGIDDIILNITWPKIKLFKTAEPATVNLIIIPKPYNDNTMNPIKIRGIHNLLKLAIEGLTEENITILDQMGNILNNFE